MNSKLTRALPALAIAAVIATSATTGAVAAAAFITGADIVNGTVTTADLKNNNVRSKDIKDGDLTAADLSPATVSSLKGATGPAGPSGPAGAAGAAGAPGISGLERVTASIVIAANGQNSIGLVCPTGKKMLGITGDWLSSFNGTSANFTTTLIGGEVYGKNTAPVPDTLRAYGTCAFVS